MAGGATTLTAIPFFLQARTRCEALGAGGARRRVAGRERAVREACRVAEEQVLHGEPQVDDYDGRRRTHLVDRHLRLGEMLRIERAAFFPPNDALLPFQFFKQPPAPQAPVYLPPPPAQGGGGGGESGGGGGGGEEGQ